MSVLDKTFEVGRYLVTYMAEPRHTGQRLDQFIQEYLPSFSREQVKRYIENGHIIISGRTPPHRPGTRVREKDIIKLIMHKTTHEDEWWNGKKIDLEEVPQTIFEDQDIIVVSKPPFMSTHPTGKHLFYCATVYFETLYKHTVHSVHRLDRETSGILILAKNPTAANHMTTAFENKDVKKCYFFIALNKNFKESDSFTCSLRLGSLDEGPERVLVHSFPEESSEGKTAKTFFEILHKEGPYVLGLAFPLTGRQHQIRVHAKVSGLPLIGDKLYLGGLKCFQRFKDLKATQEDHEAMDLPRHALHAFGIKIPYKPGQSVFITKLPLDLVQWIQKNMKVDIPTLEKIAMDKASIYFSNH